MREEIQNILKTLPNQPGIYQYFNDKGEIIYVGKAKNLKKRVTSYFNKTVDNYKTKVLVKKIVDIKYIVVDTELDALLLENNLIKKYQPKYNIQLKDDKTYPWIVIKREAFPRVFATRQFIRDGSKYFGPYSNVKVMNALLDMIKEMYKLRTCSLQLDPAKIEKSNYKVCLEYHLGNCLGPCEEYQSQAEYDEQIAEIEQILKGNTAQVVSLLKKQMQDHAAKFEFELAQKAKERLEILENFQSKSTIVSPSIHKVDVLTLVKDDTTYYVNFLNVVNGAIVHGFTSRLKDPLQQSDAEIMNFALTEMRNRFHSQSKEILSNINFEIELPDLRLTIPKMGDKKTLVDLSVKNATYYRLDQLKREAIKNPERNTERILNQIKKDFRLVELPRHMECFDNSNIQGTNPVSACVVFRDAKPSKKDYRHFNIKTVEGPNDFASMEEVVYRRYKRMLDEGQSLPNLIVIDGGKGQLSSALTALEKLDLRGKVAICGIAKKLEEIFFPGDSLPIYLDKRSESLKVIQHMRNEAHRFGITHHRSKRSKGSLVSEVESIPGIGPKTFEKLMQHFKTVPKIKSSSLESIAAIVGKAKAETVYRHFHGNLNPL